MEEILHHLGYIYMYIYNLVNNGINYQPQLVSRISEPSTGSYKRGPELDPWVGEPTWQKKGPSFSQMDRLGRED